MRRPPIDAIENAQVTDARSGTIQTAALAGNIQPREAGVPMSTAFAKWAACFAAVSGLLMSLQVVGTADAVVTTGYHLTARPWKPLGTPRERYLDAIEGDCRFTAKHQDASGAVIDPFLKREHQYATPYFAHAVGTLVEAGRAKDLLPSGVKAMEHATA